MPLSVGSQPSSQERNYHHEQRSRQDRRKLQALRNTRSTTHVDQLTHHQRSVLPSLCSVRDSPLSLPRVYLNLPTHRLNRFAQSKALSFVPPDGRFTLMEYRFDPSANKPGAAPPLTAAAAAQVQVQVPFTLRATLSITDHGGPYPRSAHLTYQPINYCPRRIRTDIHAPRRSARGRRRRALSRLRSDGRNEHRRYRWR